MNAISWTHMGGVGSGRQGGRPTIEGCASFRLSIQDLRPLLRSPGGGTAQVQCWRGDEHLIVVIEFYPSCGQLRLRHPSRVAGHAERMDYPLDLTRTVLWRDDRQWWFLCPLSGRRCGVLYLPRGASKFASAKGHGLDYAVTRMTKRDQAWRRMARISGRLGGEPSPQGPPPRPDGMRAATYRRQLRLWRIAEERLDALANARLGGLLAKIAVSKKQAALAGLLREAAAGPAFAQAATPGRRSAPPAAEAPAGVSQGLAALCRLLAAPQAPSRPSPGCRRSGSGGWIACRAAGEN